MEPRTLAAAAALALAASSCGSSRPAAGAPGPAGASTNRYDPDVPAWRGGCFFDGDSGKIVNGHPSQDIQLFGNACPAGGAPGSGGLVYLDNYDPVAGTGDVTVLSSAPGSRPKVIARSGGTGGVVPGDAGLRFDASHSHLLTLADVGVVTGTLVLVDLPDAAAPVTIDVGVRVLNYEFLPDGSVLYVGHYNPSARTGDLLLWNGGRVPLAIAIARFDFSMYRLNPARTEVAYLRNYTSSAGGDLYVQQLGATPFPPPTRVAGSVYRMAYMDDGTLVYRARNPDGITFALGIRGVADPIPTPGTCPSDPPGLTSCVNSALVLGRSVLYATGWSVLSGSADLHRVDLSGRSPADALLSRNVSLSYAGVKPAGRAPGALAYAVVTPADPFNGTLYLAGLALTSPPSTATDLGVSPAGGFSFSPVATYVAYTIGFSQPSTPGNPSPQPGVAEQLKVATVSGSSEPFQLASHASSQWIAWSPDESAVAGLASFDPAANVGQLAVARTETGAQLLAPGVVSRVGVVQFDFGADGRSLAALADWDDGLQTGTLVIASGPAGGAWTATVVDRDVSAFLRPRGGRVIYVVRDGSRDGLWLGGVR